MEDTLAADDDGGGDADDDDDDDGGGGDNDCNGDVDDNVDAYRHFSILRVCV